MSDQDAFYFEQLKEQMTFLIGHCSEYDKGRFIYAKEMSTKIRNLVKDNPKNTQSISLLKSMNIKDKMIFYNTGYRANDPLIYVGLVGIAHVPTRPPCLDPIEHLYLPVFENSELIDVQWISFEDWWDSPVLVSKTLNGNICLTRSDIVLAMAEQDGGAHIDKYEKISEDYFNISQSKSHIFLHENSRGRSVPIKNIQYAIVRQIAHELIISITKIFLDGVHYSVYYKWSNAYYLNGMSENQINQPPLWAKESGYISTRTDHPYRSSGFHSMKIVDPIVASMQIGF